MSINVLGISGSLRRASLNSAALRAAQALAPGDMHIAIADISGVPNYDQDLRDAAVPEAVTTLARAIAAADALLIATPEYNYSIPGVLKNAIDWVSREQPNPLNGKPAALMSASPGGIGGARAQYDLRKILVFSDVHVLNKPEVMIAAAHTRFDADGRLVDEQTAEHITGQLTALADFTRRLRAGN